jgi:NAD(P)-dependent dehydrogenase (short-subunit alcohol dehydrogenase family)
MITSGNSGIGLAVAKAFAREGVSVVITRRDEASLKRAGRDIGESGMALRADVSRLPEIDRAMGAIRERFKRIDALFVNAGIGKFVPFDQVTEEFFDETVAVNLKGAFFTVHKALPLLRPGAAVVLNASINAHKGMLMHHGLRCHEGGGRESGQDPLGGSSPAWHPRERDQPRSRGERARRSLRTVG